MSLCSAGSLQGVPSPGLQQAGVYTASRRCRPGLPSRSQVSRRGPWSLPFMSLDPAPGLMPSYTSQPAPSRAPSTPAPDSSHAWVPWHKVQECQIKGCITLTCYTRPQEEGPVQGHEGSCSGILRPQSPCEALLDSSRASPSARLPESQPWHGALGPLWGQMLV